MVARTGHQVPRAVDHEPHRVQWLSDWWITENRLMSSEPPLDAIAKDSRPEPPSLPVLNGKPLPRFGRIWQGDELRLAFSENLWAARSG